MLSPHAATEVLLGVGCVAALAALLWQIRAKRVLRGAVRSAEQQSEELRRIAETNWRYWRATEDETKHLVRKRLPALVNEVAREYPAVTVPGLANEELAGTPVEGYHQEVEKLFRDAVAICKRDIARAARGGLRAVIDDAQTHLARCQFKIFDELDKFPQATAYHQGLMDFDHLVTRSVHTMQRLRILAGSWPGVQRDNAMFVEIAEAARARIDAYRRVEFTYTPDTAKVWVEGRVVEPITIAVAELLSNATLYSADRVAISVQEVQSGYCIVIDDRGLGLNVFQRADASNLLTQRTLLDASNIRDGYQLGFSVVGRLAQEYDFSADIANPSAYGGVRAVLHVPHELLAEEPEDNRLTNPRRPVVVDRYTPGEWSQPDVVPEQRQAASTGPVAREQETQETTSAGLPKRRRRQQLAAPGVTQEAITDTCDPDTVAAGFAERARALNEGYASIEEGEASDG